MQDRDEYSGMGADSRAERGKIGQNERDGQVWAGGRFQYENQSHIIRLANIRNGRIVDFVIVGVAHNSTKMEMKLLNILTGLVGVITTMVVCGKDSPAAPIIQEPTTALQTMIEAISSTPPVPFDSLPKKKAYIAFWSYQNPQWPPMPGNFYNLPVWPLGDSILVDDRQLNYVELQATVELIPTMQPMAMIANSTPAYAFENPIYLTNITSVINDLGVVTTGFDIAGGTNLVPFDILMATNVPATNCNWMGIGYASTHYTFSNQPVDQAFYLLSRPLKTMVVGIGNNSLSQCNIPVYSTNVIQVAAGGIHSLAVKADGSVIAWGDNTYGKCNVPTDMSGAVQVGAGWYHSVALLSNGTVRAWGLNNHSLGWTYTEVPSLLTNAVAVSVQAMHSLALKADGTVVAWGYNSEWGETNVPPTLSNVTAISAGYRHNLAVKSDGTVVAWGDNGHGQCNVPATLNNVVDVAAGTYHSLALKSDGTVVAWGYASSAGETAVPADLTNVVAISASGDPFYTNRNLAYSMALKGDGTLVSWGDDEAVRKIASLTNVIAIGAGADHALAVRTGNLTPVLALEPTDQYQIAGGTATFTARGHGPLGVSYQWFKNGSAISGATGSTLTLTGVQASNEGAYSVGVSNENGSITSSNANFTLVRPPVISSQAPLPLNLAAPFNTNLILNVAVSAAGQLNGFPVTYQWKFNGNNTGTSSCTNAVFVESPSLGSYYVIVSNAAGSTTSSTWQVSMTYAGSYIAPGTLAYHLSTNAVGYASGHSIADEVQLSNWTYGFYSESTMGLLTNATWNPNCWLHGVKGLSATSIGISNNIVGQYPYNGAAMMITMISPRHYLRASHTETPPGMIAFLDTNNVIYWRKSIQQLNIPYNETGFIGNDISVGILDAELPSSVGYLPVLPSHYTNYLPTASRSFVQAIGRNQDMKAFGQALSFRSVAFGNSPYFASWTNTTSAPFGLGTNWNIAIRGGDSSDPESILINNQLILVSSHFGPNDAAHYGPCVDIINKYMHYLSISNIGVPDYQLTTYSLSAWPVIR